MVDACPTCGLAYNCPARHIADVMNRDQINAQWDRTPLLCDQITLLPELPGSFRWVVCGLEELNAVLAHFPRTAWARLSSPSFDGASFDGAMFAALPIGGESHKEA
jgi:hypothetical protein